MWEDNDSMTNDFDNYRKLCPTPTSWLHKDEDLGSADRVFMVTGRPAKQATCNDIFDLLYSEPFASIRMSEYKPERQTEILIDALDEMRAGLLVASAECNASHMLATVHSELY